MATTSPLLISLRLKMFIAQPSGSPGKGCPARASGSLTAWVAGAMSYLVEHRHADDPTNWFVPNRSAAEAMLRSAGFLIEAQPEREVYLCKRGDRPPMVEPPPQ